MFEQTFKNIDDILHKDAGCSSELDYVEQTSWILFLKYLDGFFIIFGIFSGYLIKSKKITSSEYSRTPFFLN